LFNRSIWSCGNCTVEHLSGQHLTNLFARNDRWPIMCIFVCSSCQTADHNRPHFIHRLNLFLPIKQVFKQSTSEWTFPSSSSFSSVLHNQLFVRKN
ncbi:hypothetical protein T4A_13395, partial [Trichinella pseudospiralis]